MSIQLTKQNFNETVTDSDKPVFIDFYADWCGPCKMAAPIIEQLSKELEGQATICKVNVDSQPELAQYFNINSIPTFILIKDNTVVDRFTGLRNKQEIRKIILSD